MIYDVRFHSWLGPPKPESEIGVPARRHVSVPSADEREMFAMYRRLSAGLEMHALFSGRGDIKRPRAAMRPVSMPRPPVP